MERVTALTADKEGAVIFAYTPWSARVSDSPIVHVFDTRNTVPLRQQCFAVRLN